jgi:hypothetical protein
MSVSASTCPGCGGGKSKRAKFCKDCRRRANAVGADVLQQIPTAAPRQRVVLRTPQQNLVYHAKCADIAALDGLEQWQATKAEQRLRELAVKARTLEWASKRFGRQIDSSTELTEAEMEVVLEHLDAELRRRLPAAVEASTP